MVLGNVKTESVLWFHEKFNFELNIQNLLERQFTEVLHVTPEVCPVISDIAEQGHYDS